MRKINIILLLFALTIGCKSTNKDIKIEEDEYKNIDTILRRNQENFIAVSNASKKSDSTISKKVEKTVSQISTLKSEVKQLKEENNELKTKVNDFNDAGEPFRLLPVSSDKDNR
jgi:predicted  nucleic acid-binding Zn-ribbon protein